MATQFYVYMMASFKGVLYVGMTRDIQARVEQHKSGIVKGFSSYRTNKLAGCELAESFETARDREAQIKRWRRSKKAMLIEAANPYWSDLSDQLFG